VGEIGIPISVKPGGIHGYHWALKGQLHAQDALAAQHKGWKILNTITELWVIQRARNFLIK
jgi:hypothetical protein